MLEFIVRIFTPKECIGCGKFGSFLCKYCENKHIRYHEEKLCHVCKYPIFVGDVHVSCRELTYLDKVSACLYYSKVVEQIIQNLKYHFFTAYVELISRLTLRVLDLETLRDSCLVPIPLSRYKYKLRGFNQTQLIADAIAKRCMKSNINVEVVELISRKVNTKTQVGMSREERQENLKNVFEINPRFECQRLNKIILIDDVMTTGTTLEECAKALKASGVNRVEALVFARG